MSRQAGSIVWEFKAAPDIRQSGPAAGGGYVLRAALKVKTPEPAVQPRGLVEWAGRSGRARTCDPRFWRPVLYQLSYTPAGNLRRRRSAPFQAYGKAELQGRTGYSSAAYTRLRSSVRKY